MTIPSPRQGRVVRLWCEAGAVAKVHAPLVEGGAYLFQRAVSRALARDGSVRVRVGALLQEIHALFRENVPAVRVAHAVFFGPREGLPPFDFSKFERVLTDAIRRLAEEGMDSGELRRVPVDDVAIAINGVLEACTDRELTPNARPLGSDGILRILDLIFDGLVPAHSAKEN